MSSYHRPASSCSHACHCIHVPGPRGPRGFPGRLIDFAEFYTVPPDGPPVELPSKVPFETDGVSLGGGKITRDSGDTFLLQPGAFRITWTVPVNRDGSISDGSNILQLNVGGVVQPNSLTGLQTQGEMLNTKTVLYRTSTAVLAFVEVPPGNLTYICQGVDGVPIPSTLVIECIDSP